MKDENVLLGPFPVVTITSNPPATILTGVLHVILVLLTTIILVADIPPNVTVLATVKEVPVIVTLVPPDLLPDDGEILVITEGVI